MGPLTDESAKLFSLDSVFSIAERIAHTLADKTWVMHKAHKSRTFYISDTPVVLYSDVKDPLRGTLGFAVPGIQIYMPISARVLLSAYCPALAARAMERISSIRSALETGKTVACIPANMDFYNSLQVAHSERFVYCRDNDFELARSMVQQHPDWRKPRRIVSGVP